MALTSDQITAQNFKDFYGQIRPYLNGSAHGGFTPIGTVISVMGKVAPHNYLICDGTIYNIADYPELAAYFTGQFESSNFFGGDGITTFAVPDLRGEFLRGAGTNSHADQGSGADVGMHQDATTVPNFVVSQSLSRLYGYSTSKNDNTVTENSDSNFNGNGYVRVDGSYVSSAGNVARYAARPTNTSILYCIATKNIFMDAGSNLSTDEQVIGTWINGKPLYQKTVSCGALPNNNTKTVNHNISNIDIITNYYGITYNSNTFFTLPYVHKSTISAQIGVVCGPTNIQLQTGTDRTSFTSTYVTLQYTKTTD